MEAGLKKRASVETEIWAVKTGYHKEIAIPLIVGQCGKPRISTAEFQNFRSYFDVLQETRQPHGLKFIQSILLIEKKNQEVSKIVN